MQPETAWKATLGELELQMTKATFNTWFRDTRLLSFDNDEFVVGVRNDYAKDWLTNRLYDTVLRTLGALVNRQVTIRFVVWSDEIIAAAPVLGPEQPASPENGQGQNADHADSDYYQAAKVEDAGRAGNGSTANGRRHTLSSPNLANNLNGQYTFTTFVVGHSNRLAHAAALSVAEQPGLTYNPLFIYGGVGLGKTHLLHAISHKCRGAGLTVCYVTSESFTNDLIQSIRSQKTSDFRDKYRTPDVLLIDDVQFIAGKESTQEELFHTFNDLHRDGKQVILSSDRPPKAMATLEERLKSRFEWGLMADIQPPDIETRLAILRTKAEASQLFVPEEVIDFIAHRVRNNIRELEGALNKVIAYGRITGTGIDMNLVNMALSDLVHQPNKVTINDIVAAVSAHYDVTTDAIRGASRSRTVAFPRQICMYLARTETNASFPQIGNELGNRDHTTILYGNEKISSLMETDSEVRRDMMTIKAALYEAQSV